MNPSEVFEIADRGDAYLACERSMIVVRQFKQRNELDDAMIFLMELAMLLADRGKWVPAIISAKRAIQMFPRSATTIRTYLKELFFKFTDIVTPECAIPDLFVFFTELMMTFPSRCTELVLKEARLADAANSYFLANKFYYHHFYLLPPEERAVSDVSPVAAMLCRWVNSLPHPIRIVQGQFIMCRAIVTFCIGNEMLSLARSLCSSIKSLSSGYEWAAITQTPLFHCAELCLKALEEKHKATFRFILEKYDRILRVDPDIIEILKVAEITVIDGRSRGRESDANRVMGLMQNLLGNLPSNG
jgi:hypothetical protein